ncbi:MAG TPA: tetratricopeptide repeat protein [Gemmatimonadota bacterium]|nr:tetratricopeptide repeat protein [Gemmatimonadota bacterium]
MSGTEDGRLRRLQELFDAALARPPSEREAFLEEACGDDAGFRERIERLLGAEASASGEFLSGAVRSATLAFGAAEDRAGVRLGPYRLVRELGHGGMGTVWLAERADAAYRARVAIKLVRGGFASPDLESRFRDERQILADLHHPSIAGLLDGGEAPDGTPYLVMEYVDGEPITDWAAARALPLRERLRLFLEVCDAVQHAHASLVVHRDIKPSNILVDADGVPRLLDFGIAKLLARGAASHTTVLGARLTPSYASPEQLRGERVTVATDVWSLGVLLYELLSGVHPFAPGEESPDEIRRRVLDQEAPRPSEVVRRRPVPGLSPRELKGDLDNIAARAMRKEPELRYATAAQLAEDVRRALAGEPVLARPASLGYRARKFVARHAAAVGAAALLFLALAAGLGATLWQARRADRARVAAEAALARSGAVEDFLTGLFRASDPDQNLGAEITARQLLERGVRRVDSLSGQPALQADLLATLGRVEMSLGEYRTAKSMFDREVGLRRELPGSSLAGARRDSLMARALNARGEALDRLGLPDSAAAAFEAAIALGSASLGEGSPVVATALENLANEYGRLGRDADAEAAFRRVIDLQRRTLDPDSPDRVLALNDLGLQYAFEGRYAKAEPLLRESVRISLLADSAVRRPVTAMALDNLGMELREAGKYDEAEPLMRRALAVRVRTLGPDHRFTAESYFSLGLLLALRGRGGDWAEADSLLHASLDVFRATLGPTHRAVGYALYALGVLDMQRRDAPAAEAWFRKALAIRRATSGDAPRETARTLVWLGAAQMARGEAAAGATLREADSLARATLATADPVRTRAAIGLAEAEARAGDRASVEPAYREALASLAARIGPAHPFVRDACATGRAAGLDGGATCAESAAAAGESRTAAGSRG